MSGPFLVVSEALSDLCLKGLGDGSFQKNPASPNLPLLNGAREALSQEEGQGAGGRGAVGRGDVLLCSDCLPKAPLTEAHTAFGK